MLRNVLEVVAGVVAEDKADRGHRLQRSRCLVCENSVSPLCATFAKAGTQAGFTRRRREHCRRRLGWAARASRKLTSLRRGSMSCRQSPLQRAL